MIWGVSRIGPLRLENKGEPDHCLEILEEEVRDFGEILEIPPVKRPLL